MSDMTAEKSAELRKKFPPSSIGKLPKAGMQLDYVGHAAVTDRLLAIDPEWSWQPMGRNPDNTPALDQEGNLWIELTICGVTRPGVGDGKSMKERIGDALRNAAMRFGVALDLWSREELESVHVESPREIVLAHHRGDFDAAIEGAQQLGMVLPADLDRYAAHLKASI